LFTLVIVLPLLKKIDIVENNFKGQATTIDYTQIRGLANTAEFFFVTDTTTKFAIEFVPKVQFQEK